MPPLKLPKGPAQKKPNRVENFEDDFGSTCRSSRLVVKVSQSDRKPEVNQDGGCGSESSGWPVAGDADHSAHHPASSKDDCQRHNESCTSANDVHCSGSLTCDGEGDCATNAGYCQGRPNQGGGEDVFVAAKAKAEGGASTKAQAPEKAAEDRARAKAKAPEKAAEDRARAKAKAPEKAAEDAEGKGSAVVAAEAGAPRPASKAKAKAKSRGRTALSEAQKKAIETGTQKGARPYGMNTGHAEMKRMGRSGTATGKKKSAAMYNRYYNGNGTLKSKYLRNLDPTEAPGQRRRSYKAQRLDEFARNELADKTVVRMPMSNKAAMFSELVTPDLLEAAREAAAHSVHSDLGDIAVARPMDILDQYDLSALNDDGAKGNSSNNNSNCNNRSSGNNSAGSDGQHRNDEENREDANCDSISVSRDEGHEEDVWERKVVVPSPPKPILPHKAPQDYTPEDLTTFLRETCGHQSFRPGQQEAISSVLSSKKTLLLLATGSGKSLCYQIPASLLKEEGLTLVVSPLISLMHDQLQRLPRNLGLRGAIVTGQQTRDEVRAVMRAVRARLVDVLFISPERLAMWSFDGCGLPPIALACIDEAHCVSEWSHNFRPDYLRLHEMLSGPLNAQRILALTATATRPTVESVSEILRIDTIVRSDRSFTLQELLSEPAQPRVQRPNLTMEVQLMKSEEQSRQELLRTLRSPSVAGKAVIIYVWRRADTHELATWLNTFLPGRVRPYHGSMPAEERMRVQDAFMQGKVQVVIATMAFGMGLDKSDTRTVIHMGCPHSIENFIQETGRCSRDGQPGRCVALLSPKTYKSMRWVQSGKGGSTGSSVVIVRKLLEMLLRTEQPSKTALHKTHELGPQALAELSLGDVPTEEGGWRPYYVSFCEADVAKELNCEALELHSALAHLAFRTKDRLTLFSRFPTQLKLRFFKTDPAELQKQDALLAKVLPLARKTGPVYTINTAAALSVLGGKPSQLSDALWKAQGDEFSVEKAAWGYMIAVLRPIEEEHVQQWSEDISTINRKALQRSIDKLDAMYLAMQRAARVPAKPAQTEEETGQTAADEALNAMIDAYFASPCESAAVAVAGGIMERQRALREALGDDFERSDFGAQPAGPGASASRAPIRNKIDRERVYPSVVRLVGSMEWREAFGDRKDDLPQVAHLASQCLAGIGSSALPVKTWKCHRCWGLFKNSSDFKHLEQCVYGALETLREVQARNAAGKAPAPTAGGDQVSAVPAYLRPSTSSASATLAA